jgi:ABC-2 type transport system ATP-binding protein
MAPVVETVALTKRFGSTLALDALDLTVPAGEVFGFLGPNGAGKTTTIRLLLGLIRASSGEVRLFGEDAWTRTVETHRRLGFVSADPALWPQLTAHETIDLLANLHGGCDAAYRDELIERFDLDPDKKLRAYSTGNRQKVALVGAFMTRPDLLVFDEPTSGLDPLRKVVFRECVAEAKTRGQTVFLSSHLLVEVEATADRVGLLRRGRVVEVGTFDELRHLSAVTVEATFDGPVPDLSGVPGVEGLTVSDHTARFQLHGAVAPALQAIAAAQPVRLTSREPSLEDVFLAHYGAED